MREPIPSKPVRNRLGAIALFGLAVFFAALLAGILDATYTGSFAGRILLRGFVVFMFGGIAAGAAAWGLREWRGRGEIGKPERSVPAVLAALCPGCGRTITDPEICPSCWHPLHSHRERWKGEEQGPWMSVFLIVIFGALLCLGAGIIIGPFLEGERRIWANIAFGGLGVLIGAVGLLGVWGGLLTLRDCLVGLRHWNYAWHFGGATAEGSTTATATTRAGVLLTVCGKTEVITGIPDSAGPLQPLRSQRPVAHAISLLHASGLASLWFESRTDWRSEAKTSKTALDPPEIVREESQELVVSLAAGSQGTVVSDDLRRLLAMLSQRLPAPVSIAALWRTVSADAEVLAFFDRFASEPGEPQGLERLLLQRLARAVEQ